MPCLPALVDVAVYPDGRMDPSDPGRLLDALAACPRLRALSLSVGHPYFRNSFGEIGDVDWPFADASAFAKLRSLTKLALSSKWKVPETLSDVVGALASFTGLAELSVDFPQPFVVPDSLVQLKGLRSLELRNMSPCVLQAGCLELPKLLSLNLRCCNFEETEVLLSGVTALQCLTCIEFSSKEGPCIFDPRLVQLPLQRIVMSQDPPFAQVYSSAPLRLLGLPADMGALCSTLLHLDISGLRLAQFPVALSQLVALKCLDASRNDFTELPAGITALSGLTEVTLGRGYAPVNPGGQLHGVRALSAVAMGDLSGFPALRKLTFAWCEVWLCMSLLGGAVRHTSLESICFLSAYPSQECAPMVLQLRQELRRLRRGSILKLINIGGFENTWADRVLRGEALPPLHKFHGRHDAGSFHR